VVQLPGPLSTRAFTAGAALLLTALCLAGPIREAVRLENKLSPVADPYSESNAIRSALAVLERGWTAHAGLPESTYGGAYPETGHFRRYGGKTHIDTHYPPGPTWLTAAMKLGCGQRPLSCARALPLAVAALGAFVLAFALIASLGPARGIAAALAAFAVPLYSNMMLGLHYQGYALALLSIQLGALLVFSSSGRELRARELLLIAGLTFLQGWLSFDYFFLVTLAPLPVALLFSDLRESAARRRLFALVLAGAAGFALAHGLHFLQVVAYHGEVAAAAKDLFGVALERTDPTLSTAEPPPHWSSDPWMMSSIFLFVLSERDTHFGFRLGWTLLAALAALILLRGRSFPLPATRLRLGVEASPRLAWAVVAGVLVSCAWISVMPGHAHTHPHFIPRHLFLAWLVMVVALLSAFRLEASPRAAA
jgi:hypothetical protein